MTWSRDGDGDIVVGTPNNKQISFKNPGSSSATDYGRLDVDDKTGTGPENIFWSSSGPAPPNGTYYVCFEPYAFSMNATGSNPISVAVKVVRSANTMLTFRRNFTSHRTDSYQCDASSKTLLGSFTYP